MTKSKPKSPGPKPLPITEKAFRSWTWLYILVVVVLAGIPFAYGKYFEFKTPGPFDSATNVYSAKVVLEGARIGIEHRPSAMIGTLLVNMLGVWLFGYRELGPELIQMLFQTTALVFMGVVLYRLYGRLAAGVSVFVASFCLSAPHIAKFGNVKEQYMIAMMVVGVSCYVLGQIGGRWWWTLLAGMALSWGPLFKETGTSALGAVGLFVLVQPLLKWRDWKQTLRDISLLVGGFVLATAPVILWLAADGVSIKYWPYGTILRIFIPIGDERMTAYVTGARKMVDSADVTARILRYYGSLALPIVLACLGLVLGMVHAVQRRRGKAMEYWPAHGRFVLLFGTWWIVDMAYCWISPRTYEQYFLPLNASAAMCGAWGLACYAQQWKRLYKIPWLVMGVIGTLVLILLGGPLVYGMCKSPHSGTVYKNGQTGQPENRRGYQQKWRELKDQTPGGSTWEKLGDYIRTNSQPKDGLYVWGWYPGIYLRAQRFCPATVVSEAQMHTKSPEALAQDMTALLQAFQQDPPKFIVDSGKNDFPYIRPNLELWPRLPGGTPFPKLDEWFQANAAGLPWEKRFLAGTATAAQRDTYDALYSQYLTIYMQLYEKAGQGTADPQEVERFHAMRPLRDYLMDHYVVSGQLGIHILFQRK